MANNTNPMTEKQFRLIATLFMQVRDLLGDEKRERLIEKMKAHKNGEVIQTTVWASQVIEILKGLKTKENLRIAKERRANSNQG